jgi:DNA-directed RNA polymerase specialized sigma24 family protein
MTDPNRVEDLAQEGWIAIWKATQTWCEDKAPQDWWLKRKAHNRMLMLVNRDWQTVKATQDRTVGNAHDVELWSSLTAELIGVEMAYHEGELLQALNCLTSREREYVVLRFWGGYRKQDMIAHFGYEPTGLWRRAKIKLKETLKHLEMA